MGGCNKPQKRILVVDDDIRTTELLARMLREDGHDVEVAHDAASAMALLTRSSILDVLVTDLQMPRGDGFTIAHYAREQQPFLPIFFVTGYPDRVSRRLRSLDPQPHVFVKPLDYAALSNELLGLEPHENRPRQ
jgi:CheY-like chemotaxis protein